MRTRSGVGRTEIIIGVVVVLVIAAIAVPLLMSGADKSRQAELPLYVESIRTAEIQLMEVFQEYQSAEAAPRAPTAVDATPVPWVPTRGFERLSWSPDDLEKVYGSYRVVLTTSGFNVLGTADIDGDGKRAEYIATEAVPAAASSNAEFH